MLAVGWWPGELADWVWLVDWVWMLPPPSRMTVV
jgi:hypothetical protein